MALRLQALAAPGYARGFELTRHTDLLLTQHAERLPRFFANRPVPVNVWLGVTVEDRRHGLPRIAHLRRVPARVRFLSVEPLLEDLGPLPLEGIHWVIVGGESGLDARPMRPEWALAVRDQCETAGVAFTFRQCGTGGADGVRRNKQANGRVRAGRSWDERPERAGVLLERGVRRVSSCRSRGIGASPQGLGVPPEAEAHQIAGDTTKIV